MSANRPEASAKSKPTVKASKPTARVETRWDRTKANMKTIGGAVLLAIFIRIVLFEAFEIEGPSMEPTLLNGDRVVVAKFMYGLFLPFTTEAVLTWGSPDPGEVVIVKSPADDIDIVKRVIGGPGDTIEIRDDVVYRNGEALPHEEVGECRDDEDRAGEDLNGCIWVRQEVAGTSFLTSHSVDSPESSHPPVTVPEGHVYIMGDHRDRSNDSRFFGVVPIERVKGEALVIYWSNENGVRWNRLFEAVQ